MKNKQKPRKRAKYNSTKRAIRCSGSTVRIFNLGFAFVQGFEPCIFDIRVRKKVAPKNELRFALCEVPHIWTIFITVFDNANTSIEIATPEPILQSKLGADIADHVKELQGGRDLAYGWVAIPKEYDFDKTAVLEIYDKIRLQNIDKSA